MHRTHAIANVRAPVPPAQIRPLPALALAACALAGARPARAGDTAAEFGLFAHAGYLPALPASLSPLGTVHTNPNPEQDPYTLQRDLDGSIASRGSSAYWAVGFDVRAVHRQTWVVPIFGLSIGGALGASDAVTSSLDGTIVQMEPWTMGYFSVLLPGLGVRAHTLHTSVSLSLRTTFNVAWMDGQAAVGNSTVGFSAAAVSFGLRADLEGCYRMDPTHRTCLYVQPNVYEFGAFNGGTVGLRMDWGP